NRSYSNILFVIVPLLLIFPPQLCDIRIVHRAIPLPLRINEELDLSQDYSKKKVAKNPLESSSLYTLHYDLILTQIP
ncbi:15743_t:CDS:2, partial [Cetraspora pellucida]